MARQLARLHPPTCSGLCLDAGTLASPSRKHRMSGSACCWGPTCPTPPLCSPGSWVNPGYTCLPSPGSWSRILACPSPRVGLPCGTQRSGCGPGTTRPRTPGQGGSLTPKVWAFFSPLGLGGVWWASLASQRCNAISCDRHGGLPQRPVCWPLQASSSCGWAVFQAPFYAEFCQGLGPFLSDSTRKILLCLELLSGRQQGGLKPPHKPFKRSTLPCEACAEVRPRLVSP